MDPSQPYSASLDYFSQASSSSFAVPSSPPDSAYLLLFEGHGGGGGGDRTVPGTPARPTTGGLASARLTQNLDSSFGVVPFTPPSPPHPHPPVRGGGGVLAGFSTPPALHPLSSPVQQVPRSPMPQPASSSALPPPPSMSTSSSVAVKPREKRSTKVVPLTAKSSKSNHPSCDRVVLCNRRKVLEERANVLKGWMTEDEELDWFL